MGQVACAAEFASAAISTQLTQFCMTFELHFCWGSFSSICEICLRADSSGSLCSITTEFSTPPLLGIQEMMKSS